MFNRNEEYNKLYFDTMENIKKMNEEYINIECKYNKVKVAKEILNELIHLRFDKLRSQIKKRTCLRKERKISYKQRKTIKNEEVSYVSNSRIAVYTSIFGEYDNVQEPVVIPDNCDFYIITDNEIPKESLWKKINPKEFSDIDNMNNIYKNRYFKMNPHKVFPNYEYSIYIDGNIKVITDLSELVNKVGKCGIAMHSHATRNCITQEAKACDIWRKENLDVINKQIEKYFQEGMPKEFGLLQASVIVRKHNSEQCIRIMSEWWHEFINGCKRDQISLPYILWKNKCSVNDIGVLGEDIYKNYSLRIVEHN